MSALTLLVLGGLVVLVLLGSRWGFGNPRLPGLLRPVADTGLVFLFAGAIIGPQGLGWLSRDMLQQLSPVVVIGLGWIGFLFGSHFEVRLLRRYPAASYGAAFLQSVVTLLAVAGAAWWVLGALLAPEMAAHDRAAAALILGICAAGTAPAGVFQLPRGRGYEGADVTTMRFFSAVDDIPALLALGLMNALLHPTAQTWLAGWPWFAITLGLGVGLGLVAHWLFPSTASVQDNSLILLGVIALGAGGAAMLRVTPLLVLAIAGFVFANLSPRSERAYGLLSGREHDLYSVFLLVAGTLFLFDWRGIYLLVPLFVLVRVAGKVTGGWLGRRLFMPGARVSPLIGMGLLFQGGLALALAVSFERTHESLLTHHVATTIVLAVLVNEVVGPLLAQLTLAGRRGA